jgi:hypothetical protein
MRAHPEVRILSRPAILLSAKAAISTWNEPGRFSEREERVLGSGAAAAVGVQPAVGGCREPCLGGDKPSSGEFFEAEPERARRSDHDRGQPVAFGRLARGQREGARRVAPDDRQVACVRVQGERDGAGNARGRGGGEDLLHGLFAARSRRGTRHDLGRGRWREIRAERGCVSEQFVAEGCDRGARDRGVRTGGRTGEAKQRQSSERNHQQSGAWHGLGNVLPRPRLARCGLHAGRHASPRRGAWKPRAPARGQGTAPRGCAPKAPCVEAVTLSDLPNRAKSVSRLRRSNNSLAVRRELRSLTT